MTGDLITCQCFCLHVIKFFSWVASLPSCDLTKIAIWIENEWRAKLLLKLLEQNPLCHSTVTLNLNQFNRTEFGSFFFSLSNRLAVSLASVIKKQSEMMSQHNSTLYFMVIAQNATISPQTVPLWITAVDYSHAFCTFLKKDVGTKLSKKFC